MYGFNFLGVNTKLPLTTTDKDVDDLLRGASPELDTFREVKETLDNDYYTKEEIDELLKGSSASPVVPTSYATQDYVTTQINSLKNLLVDGASADFDTFNEIAKWLSNDENQTAATIIKAINNHALEIDSLKSTKLNSLSTEQLAVVDGTWLPAGTYVKSEELNNLSVKELVETTAQKYLVENTAYSIDTIGNNIIFNIKNVNSGLTSGTGLTSWLRHIISNGEIVGTDVYTLTMKFGETSIVMETSGTASDNPSDVDIKLVTLFGTMAGKTPFVLGDLVGKSAVMEISKDSEVIETYNIIVRKEYLSEHLDISGKQDVIEDLQTIKDNAALGATAVQQTTFDNYFSVLGLLAENELFAVNLTCAEGLDSGFNYTQTKSDIETKFFNFISTNNYPELFFIKDLSGIYKVTLTNFTYQGNTDNYYFCEITPIYRTSFAISNNIMDSPFAFCLNKDNQRVAVYTLVSEAKSLVSFTEELSFDITNSEKSSGISTDNMISSEFVLLSADLKTQLHNDINNSTATEISIISKYGTFKSPIIRDSNTNTYTLTFILPNSGQLRSIVAEIKSSGVDVTTYNYSSSEAAV